MAAAAKGISLNHIAMESPDIKRLATFYQEIDLFGGCRYWGLRCLEGPTFEGVDVKFLSLPPFFSLHLVEREPSFNLPERHWPFTDPKTLSRGHHLAFSISNFDSFALLLKEKKIEFWENFQPNGDKQIFFFDPDGNGLEVGTYAPAYNP